MENNLIEVDKSQFFNALHAEQKNIVTTTIEGGGKGNFFPLTDMWYYYPNQSNVFGKTIEYGSPNQHLNKYYLASK